MAKIEYVDYEYRDATYRLSRSSSKVGIAEIVRQRDLLEACIESHPHFAASLRPISIENATPIAADMIAAAALTNVGPMAAVAGAIAEYAARAMIRDGAAEAIINNGGDLYVHARRTVIVGLFSGADRDGDAEDAGDTTHGDSATRQSGRQRQGFGQIALRLAPDLLPCAVCSSSATMGHSASFGGADLATVVGEHGAVADAAATALCNAVNTTESAAKATETIAGIRGVYGALAIINGIIAFAGPGIDLVRHEDPDVVAKVTAHPESEFFG